MAVLTASEKPSVLFVAPVEPWCRENGSSVITADMLDGLLRNTDVDILPVFLREPPPGYQKSAPAGNAGIQLSLEGLPRWSSVLRALARGTSPVRMRFANGKVARRVQDAVDARNFKPHVIHVEHLPLVDIGLKLARIYNAPLVYRAHNIEAQLWTRRLGVNGKLGRAIARYLNRSEAEAMRSCDRTLCISDVDLAWVRANAPEARAELLPAALLVDRYDAVSARYLNADPQICFVGGLEWAPNEVGLRWFVELVLPKVLQTVPNAKLAVLARGAAEREWLRDHPAVQLLPPEADAPSLFASSRVSVAPLLQGGGVRIKILESLALGCPVVATPIGGEGLELPALTRTEDTDAFAAACIQHLQAAPDTASRRRLRAAVDANNGAETVAQRLVHSWLELAGRTLAEERARAV
ncbi:MAG TPA: glycosyltransferase family 4 protein [Longimicrobiales bacterium]|nr:glycosyltransferase family 4 protein [Longimicrobiales bacterium]